MIDLHSHILPSLDDGPQTAEDALIMAKAAVRDGITVVAATPHHRNGVYDNEGTAIVEHVDQFNVLLRQHEIPLTVVPGQELHFNHEMIQDLYAGNKILTLNRSRYLLLEFPSNEVPQQTADMLHELAVLGITPIIAHPERNREISRDPDLLMNLIQLGALSQVTSQSLAGKFGPKLQQLSLKLCRRNLVHIIASDAHNDSTRPFLMSEALTVVRAELGVEYENYFLANAEHIFHNRDFEAKRPAHRGKKKIFFWKR